jgi:hypothetical protein
MLSDSVLELGVSAKGLGNLRENVFEQDFTFIIGNDRWQCASFIAAFLPPRIAALQGNDPTLREFMITTNDPFHYFESFLFLGFGSTMKIASTNSTFFRSICCELWNQELYDQLFDCFENHHMCDNVFDQLKFLIATNHSYELEIVFVHHICLNSIHHDFVNFHMTFLVQLFHTSH